MIIGYFFLFGRAAGFLKECALLIVKWMATKSRRLNSAYQIWASVIIKQSRWGYLIWFVLMEKLKQ